MARQAGYAEKRQGRSVPCTPVLLSLGVWILITCFAVAGAADSAGVPQSADVPEAAEPAVFQSVIDNRTLEVLFRGEVQRVNLIGVGRRGPGLNGDGASGKDSFQQGDALYLTVQDQGDDGALWAYVYRESGTLLNELLLERGHAFLSICPPSTAHLDRFLSLQKKAQIARRGVWAETNLPSFAGLALPFDGLSLFQEGITIAALDVAEERVVLSNGCPWSVDLSAWRLVSMVGGEQRYTFPAGTVVPSGGRVEVKSGPDQEDAPYRLRWTSRYVWNNQGDLAVLMDPDGRFVSGKYGVK